ncbi:hypothetical protein GCM10009077_10070 [Roseibium denhamense]
MPLPSRINLAGQRWFPRSQAVYHACQRPKITTAREGRRFAGRDLQVAGNGKADFSA